MIDFAIVQFGGQTAINAAEPLEKAGIPLLGTSFETLDALEDRDLFYQLLDDLGLKSSASRVSKDVPSSGMPAFSSGSAALIAVCPPNWTMAKSMFSCSATFKICSVVSADDRTYFERGGT